MAFSVAFLSPLDSELVPLWMKGDCNFRYIDKVMWQFSENSHFFIEMGATETLANTNGNCVIDATQKLNIFNPSFKHAFFSHCAGTFPNNTGHDYFFNPVCIWLSVIFCVGPGRQRRILCPPTTIKLPCVKFNIISWASIELQVDEPALSLTLQIFKSCLFM